MKLMNLFILIKIIYIIIILVPLYSIEIRRRGKIVDLGKEKLWKNQECNDALEKIYKITDEKILENINEKLMTINCGSRVTNKNTKEIMKELNKDTEESKESKEIPDDINDDKFILNKKKEENIFEEKRKMRFKELNKQFPRNIVRVIANRLRNTSCAVSAARIIAHYAIPGSTVDEYCNNEARDLFN